MAGCPVPRLQQDEGDVMSDKDRLSDKERAVVEELREVGGYPIVKMAGGHLHDLVAHRRPPCPTDAEGDVMGEQWEPSAGDEVRWQDANGEIREARFVGMDPWAEVSPVAVVRSFNAFAESVALAALSPAPASPPLLEDVLRGPIARDVDGDGGVWAPGEPLRSEILDHLRAAYLPDHPDATIGALLGGGDDGGR